jgi:uncharacterized phage protein (TIGR01671 family)
MRTIKFRVKRVDNGEWVYGYLYVGQNDYYIMEIVKSGFQSHKVIPETVCQFTGLKDKNGKEIYEGDIVVDKSWQNEKPQVVTWERRFLLTYTDGYGVQRYDYTGDVSKKFEVIGNIHDNPELLGERK